MDSSEYLPKTTALFVLRSFSVLSSLLFIYIWMGSGEPLSPLLIYGYTGTAVLVGGILLIAILDRYVDPEYNEAFGQIVVDVRKISHNRLAEVLVGIGSVTVFAGLATLIVETPTGYGTSVAFFTLFAVGITRYMTHVEDLPTYITDYETDWTNPTSIDDVPLSQPSPRVERIFGKTQFLAQIATLLTVITILLILVLSAVSLFNLWDISMELYQSAVLTGLGVVGISAFLRLFPSPSEFSQLNQTDHPKLIIRFVLTSSYGLLAFGTVGYLFTNSLLTFTPATVLLFLFMRSWGTNTAAFRSTREATHKLSPHPETEPSEDAE